VRTLVAVAVVVVTVGVPLGVECILKNRRYGKEKFPDPAGVFLVRG